MASSSSNRSNANKKNTSSRTRSSSTQGRKTNTSRAGSSRTSAAKKKEEELESKVFNEVVLILIFAGVVFLFLCTVGIIGGKGETRNFGDYIQEIMFGLFGILAYVVPLITFFAIAFSIANKNSKIAVVKIVSLVVLIVLIGILAQLIFVKDMDAFIGSKTFIKDFYHLQVKGGGVIFGSVALLFVSLIGKVGTVFVVIVLGIISVVILTGKSFIKGVKNGGKKLYESTAAINEKRNNSREEDTSNEQDPDDNDAEILRMDKKVVGVTKDTLLPRKVTPTTMDTKKEDIKGSSVVQNSEEEIKPDNDKTANESNIKKNDIHQILYKPQEETGTEVLHGELHTADWYSPSEEQKEEEIVLLKPLPDNEIPKKSPVQDDILVHNLHEVQIENVEPKEEVSTKPVAILPKEKPKTQPKSSKYSFPPISLLHKSEKSGQTNDSRALEDTARRLEETLLTFGVKVKVTDYSQGPAVTRYELHPEQGVKVSKILSLADDIKLNLAAADIRIEAPIPGKMAVGIEVPNKSSSAVSLREMFETNDFKDFQSKLCFAVGKDIGGKPIVTDIGKMPHLLIAGATGSGKSVCINTLIMSILYKACPDEVKLIMIDPKVVELSVYNGIPHLMIPVVTDPQKASAALKWGVSEMTDRYKKFADYGVRDLKGYNQKAEELTNMNSSEAMSKLPQIVIIVDELADLMMVASKEVEESICRLAQLARAAGIHLIIATQRPSADVITGLIKTNMPSRIAFSVSSGIDSRIILDENGAEKLLGKGDMLFFPQGFTKPSRVQGAFVSDEEVASIVDYIKNNALGNTYSTEVEEKLTSTITSSSTMSAGNNDRDEYFADAGRFLIEKKKGSIGMLQRFFRIGFNRAARIMDQLEEAGVVSSDEGTKARDILMDMDEFENYLLQSGNETN